LPLIVVWDIRSMMHPQHHRLLFNNKDME
jgi:hypothetical protein